MTPGRRPDARAEHGQALVLLVAALVGVALGAIVLGSVARGLGERADRQRAADLAALAAARAMRSAYPRLFTPPLVEGRPDPAHLERAAYLAIGAATARTVARANGAPRAIVAFPAPDPVAPTRVRVVVDDRIVGGRVAVTAAAEAELVPPGAATGLGDTYDGPLAYRQGRPMRPDVATAFDRMARAARADGVDLVIASAFRPDGSLHRLATELELGPRSAEAWLARNASRFHFAARGAGETAEWGYVLNAASRGAVAAGRDGAPSRDVPDFVPARFAPLFAAAAQRWSVSAALLAAQAYRESGLNPFARSPAGAQGIAQLMPGTARSLGVTNAFDPAEAIDAQAHLMRDLLRRFGAVPLALAAYNAGPGRVAACLCVPPIAETQAYVAAILGMLGGIGVPTPGAGGGLEVRLVR